MSTSQQALVLNWRKILAHITEDANLPIHSEESHITASGTYTSSIKLDIAVSGFRPQRVTTTITADSTISENHATEKAAHKATKMIVENGNIVIAQLLKLPAESDMVLQEKDQLLAHLAYACTCFGDTLPIEIIRPSTIPEDLSTAILNYTGSTPPSTHLEQLAFFIAHSIIGPEYIRISSKSEIDELI